MAIWKTIKGLKRARKNNGSLTYMRVILLLSFYISPRSFKHTASGWASFVRIRVHAIRKVSAPWFGFNLGFVLFQYNFQLPPTSNSWVWLWSDRGWNRLITSLIVLQTLNFTLLVRARVLWASIFSQQVFLDKFFISCVYGSTNFSFIFVRMLDFRWTASLL